MAAIGTILAIFDLQVISMLPTKFRVNTPFGSGEESKKDFLDGPQGDHLAFPIGTISANFDLQVTPMLPTKFPVKWLSVQEKKRKLYFQDGAMATILDFRSERF